LFAANHVRLVFFARSRRNLNVAAVKYCRAIVNP
jgi:hypothetical protein